MRLKKRARFGRMIWAVWTLGIAGTAAAEAPSYTPQTLVVVHGIGNQRDGEYQKFKDMIRAEFEHEVRRIAGVTPPRDALIMKTAKWSDVTQPDQETYNQRYSDRYGRAPLMRKLMVTFGGDALAYALDKKKAIVARVTSAVNTVAGKARQAAGGKKADLTVVGHSWGTVAASDAMWDMTLGRGPALPRNLDWKHFVTLGGPLPTVAQRAGLDNLQPVRPKSWTNIWYHGDFVGQPLGVLNPKYAAVVKDVRYKTAKHHDDIRGVLRNVISRIPVLRAASHKFYFADPRVVARIARPMAVNYVNRGTGSKSARR